MPAGAKVPDSTAIVLYHFNDVWMGPSVKHVLGVHEWSYVVPENFFFSKMEFGFIFT